MRLRAVLLLLALSVAGLAGWGMGFLVSASQGAKAQAPSASNSPGIPSQVPSSIQVSPVFQAVPRDSVPESKRQSGSSPGTTNGNAGNIVFQERNGTERGSLSLPPSSPPGTNPGLGNQTLALPMPEGPARGSDSITPASAVQQVEAAASGSAAEQTPDNPTARQEPCVSMEFVGPPTAKLKQTVTYQIVLKNVSSVEVQQVVVRYRLPNGVTMVGADPKPSQDGTQFVWEIGTLQPRQEKRLDVQLLASVKGDLACQASISFAGVSTARLQVREPKLKIKASAPEKALLGDSVTVSLTVSNPGDGTADQVKVRAQLSEGLEHVRGKTIEFNLGNMGPNESRSVQLVCNTIAAGAQQCDAVATGKDDLTAQDSAAIEVTAPRLLLAMSGPGLRYLERKATYILKVTNPGSASASNVTVTDVIPAGFKFVAASDGGHHDFGSRTVTWFVGDMTPGQSRDIALELMAVNVGEHKQTAAATATRGLKAEAEIQTRVEGLSALLMELVDLDDPVEVGAETSYEIRITNTGTKTEQNVQLICTVPDKMEFRGARGPGSSRFQVAGKDVIFEPLLKLAPRADAIFRVKVKGLAAGDLRFRAQMKADGLTSPVLKEESTKVYGDEAIKN